MIDHCAALALPNGRAAAAPNWPLPELRVPPTEIAGWRERIGLARRSQPAVALAPGAVGPSKRWPACVLRRARAAV